MFSAALSRDLAIIFARVVARSGNLFHTYFARVDVFYAYMFTRPPCSFHCDFPQVFAQPVDFLRTPFPCSLSTRFYMQLVSYNMEKYNSPPQNYQGCSNY